MAKNNIFNKAEEYANTNFPQNAENNVALHSFIDGANWMSEILLKGDSHVIRPFNLDEFTNNPNLRVIVQNGEKVASIEINEEDEDTPVVVTDQHGYKWCCGENGKFFPDDITISSRDIFFEEWNF